MSRVTFLAHDFIVQVHKAKMSHDVKGTQGKTSIAGMRWAAFFSTGQDRLKDKNPGTGRGKMVGSREFHNTENTRIDFQLVQQVLLLLLKSNDIFGQKL